MADVYEDVISAELDHPHITIQNVDQRDSGTWFANIKYAGTEQNLLRLITPSFDIQGEPMEVKEGTYARLVPNIEEL